MVRCAFRARPAYRWRPNVLNLRQIHRVVHRHDWIDLSEWVNGIDCLADLTDQELEEVERMSRPAFADAAKRV